jgi:hypothetical protein
MHSVKTAREKPATLYRLPARFAGVTSIPGVTGLHALPELTTRRAAPGACREASERGYTPLHADSRVSSIVKCWKYDQTKISAGSSRLYQLSPEATSPRVFTLVSL